MKPIALAGAVCLLLAAGVAAKQSAGQSEQMQYSGTLGQSRIGVTLEVDNGRAIRGHYFYQKYLKDIPVTAAQESGTRLLKVAGGVLKLHFKGNGSEGHAPLTFENSVGLDGTWTSADGARSLPVRLRGQMVLAKSKDGRRYSDVTSESDAAFEKRVQAFYRAVLAGNRTEATRYVSYPLRVNGKHPRTIKNAAQLLAAWDFIFTPTFMAKLRNDLPHDMFVHQGMAMLGDGDVWFDAKGAAVVNVTE
jgi:hypothetical protein